MRESVLILVKRAKLASTDSPDDLASNDLGVSEEDVNCLSFPTSSSPSEEVEATVGGDLVSLGLTEVFTFFALGSEGWSCLRDGSDVSFLGFRFKFNGIFSLRTAFFL